MKKAIKKLMATLLAVAMLCAMAVPAMAEGSAKGQAHTFNAYQIFTGTISSSKDESTALGSIEWGSGIKNSATFISALKTDVTIGSDFESVDVSATDSAAKVAKIVESYGSDSTKAEAFARVAYANKADTAQYTGTTSVVIGAAGYYLFVDTTAFDADATDTVFGLALLNVAKAGDSVTPRVKTDTPSVSKYVEDNNDGSHAGGGDNDGYGKTADHNINEEFHFKLVATLPATTNFAAYEAYKVVFHDSMSAGIVFDGIESVQIDDVTVPGNSYTLSDNATVGASGPLNWTLTIDNVKSLGADLSDGAEITVIYKAHLNESAYVNHESGTTDNKNTVSLEYSNNPNASGSGTLGKTPEETVYVFTYQVNNTKRAGSAEGKVLKDAEFHLYKDSAHADEVKLVWNASKKAYSPVSGSAAGEVIKSQEDGSFNIAGLDAGTYYLHETKAPDGYNVSSEDVVIVINANHTRTDEGHVTLDSNSNMTNTVINNAGATLPSTGGIGTTIFYVVGGGLMVAAAVLLITKKRMENK